MKIAIISDIHGNLEALESVLRDIEKEGAEKIHFLGDAVGYGCDPNDCVRLISSHCDIKLLGNHDYAVMGLETIDNFNQLAQASMSWTMAKISEKSISILADFEMEADFLNFHMVHASPNEPDQWHYILAADHARGAFDCLDQAICLVGHSHIPGLFVKHSDNKITMTMKTSFECNPGKKYIINVGSVGQPRDNDPRSCYLLTDTDTGKMQFRRVDYDIKVTQAKMEKAKLPDFLIERLAIGV